MSNIFLGPIRYWISLVITIIIVFLPGLIYMHVTRNDACIIRNVPLMVPVKKTH